MRGAEGLKGSRRAARSNSGSKRGTPHEDYHSRFRQDRATASRVPQKYAASASNVHMLAPGTRDTDAFLDHERFHPMCAGVQRPFPAHSRTCSFARFKATAKLACRCCLPTSIHNLPVNLIGWRSVRDGFESEADVFWDRPSRCVNAKRATMLVALFVVQPPERLP